MSERITELAAVPYAEGLGDEVRLTAEDRPWMEGGFGCEWPDEADERQWLESVNELVEVGSVSIRAVTGAEHDEHRAAVVKARQAFFGMLPAIPGETLDRVRKYSAVNTDIVVRPAVFIETQRLFYAKGLDGASLVNSNPANLTSTAKVMAQWFDGVGAAGLDGAALLKAAPSLGTLSAGSILERLQPMYAAARSAGFEDYRQEAHKFVSRYAATLSYKPDKVRTLTRIIADHSMDVSNQEDLVSLLIQPLERSVVAALQYGDVIGNTNNLYYHDRQYREFKRDELRGIIAGYIGSGSRIVKAYLQGYPIDDPEAAQEVYARHVRARERHKEKVYPLFWQGPAVLGDPQLSPLRAYASVVDSPDLSDEQFKELAGYAASGREARSGLEDLSVRHTDSEIREKMRDDERGKRARNALIARHLGLVVEIAQECKRGADWSEIVGIGNVALTSFVHEEYQPEGSDDEPERFRLQAAAAVMRSLIGYHPRYQGRELKTVEAALAGKGPDQADDEGAMPAVTNSRELPWILKG